MRGIGRGRIRSKLLVAATAGALAAATLAPATAMADEYILVEGGHHFVFPGIGIVAVEVDDLGEFTVIGAPTVHFVTQVIAAGKVVVIPATPIEVDVEEIEPGSYEISVDDVGSVIIEVKEDGTVEVVQPLDGYSVVFVDGEFRLVSDDDPTVILIGEITKVIIIVDHVHHHHHGHDDDSSS